MTPHVAFLRGMNLGGRRISNEELRAHCLAVGLADAQPVRASGNIVFSGEERSDAKLGERVETGLLARLGYPVRTFIRSAPELSSIMTSCPFPPGSVTTSSGKLQVALLDKAPNGHAQAEVLALNDGDDLLGFAGRELYWLPDGRISASRIELRMIEAVTGPMTVRTMGTIEWIAERL